MPQNKWGRRPQLVSIQNTKYLDRDFRRSLMQLLVRNKIADLSTWHSYFDGDRSLVAEVGVTLQHL